MKNYVFGADVGGTNIKLGLFELPKMRLAKWIDFKTPNENQDEAIFDEIIANVHKLITDIQVDFANIKGIGIAIPCPVIDGKITSCANLGWSNMDIKKALKDKLPNHVHVAVSNDASMAAYGENKELKQPYENAVFYTLGTGVGGGLIINGKIIEGKHGAASEFGHIKVFDGFDDEVCGCGGNGCLEQIAGTKGIFRLLKQYSVFEKTTLDLNHLTVKKIFDAAKVGDGPALKTVNRVANIIGENAATIALVVDPQIFIIGGGIAASGKFLLDKIVASYQEQAKFTTKNTPFELAKLENKAGAYGAAHLVADQFFNN